jgi:hypothetical protein
MTTIDDALPVARGGTGERGCTSAKDFAVHLPTSVRLQGRAGPGARRAVRRAALHAPAHVQACMAGMHACMHMRAARVSFCRGSDAR